MFSSTDYGLEVQSIDLVGESDRADGSEQRSVAEGKSAGSVLP